MKSRPVYLSGHYRSGTTLLSNILDKSLDFTITYGTIHYMRSYGKYLPINERYTELIDDTCNRIRDKWSIDSSQQEMKDRIAQHNPITEAVVYDTMMRVFLNLTAEERWGEKTNVNWEGMLPFLGMFPEGKAVHIIRDPRAVLASFKFFTYQPEPRYLDALFAALAMFHFVGEKAVAENPAILLMRYEDLVNKPQEEVAKLCAFLEIDFEEEMLTINSKKSAATYNANSSFFKDKGTIDATSLNLWQEKLTKTDIALAEELLGDVMKAWNYQPLNLELNAAEKQALEEIKAHPYIAKRLTYVAQTGSGVQAFPDDEVAYGLG